jgi:hypothetical protein
MSAPTKRAVKLTSEEWALYEEIRKAYKIAYYGPVGKLWEYLARKTDYEKLCEQNPALARMAQQSVDREHK